MLRREDLVLKGDKKGLSNGQLFFNFFICEEIEKSKGFKNIKGKV
ncbi:hypothetical protein BMWSH_4626 [Priestia megaterium WSH-002]|uniref:Uncharacterized protein n=1 Tax=Priestia megaterium (strain WSH-002) TaxID=1006007 RepID=A0A8D3X2S4_PRIMW|nr:hypothetical protein BMWSH_4626 [Priestia megaterium WSH-002]